MFYIKIVFERAFQKKSLTRLYQTKTCLGWFYGADLELLPYRSGVVLLKEICVTYKFLSILFLGIKKEVIDEKNYDSRDALKFWSAKIQNLDTVYWYPVATVQ